MPRLNSWPVVYEAEGYVKSSAKRHMLAMRPANFLARPYIGTTSASRAYKAPMNAPIEVPPIMSMGIPASSKALMIPTCDMPLAPPPPRTSPMDLPHSRLAILWKSPLKGVSAEYSGVCRTFREVYFWISAWRTCTRCFKAEPNLRVWGWTGTEVRKAI